MANPTTNKPSAPAFSASLGFGATCQSFVPFCETAGLPIEAKQGIAGRSYDAPTGYGTGAAPAIVPGGFPHAPSAGPSLKFGYGAPAVTFPGGGFPSAGLAAQRTYAAVFKVNYALPPTTAPGTIPLFGTGLSTSNSTANGLALVPGLSGYSVCCYRNYGATSAAVFAGLIQPGKWYAIALSVTTGATTRTYQCYDYTAQALLASAVTQNDATAMTEPATSDLVLNPLTIAGFANYPFCGEFAAVALDNQPWDAATLFPAFYADPWAVARGSYTASGALVAGQGAVQHCENGVVAVSFAGATGIGTGGTGAPTYYLHRTADLSAAPSAGDRIATLAPNASGNLSYVDAAAPAGAISGYRIEAADGSSAAYYPATSAVPLTGRPRAGSNLGILFIGDSRTESYSAPLYGARQILEFGDRKVNWLNRGKSGSYASAWSNGAASRSTLSIAGGTPTSGNFGVSVNVNGGAASSTGATIPYNCSAATLQAALAALANVGAGNVTCSGGPLPGAAIAMDFPTFGAYATSLQPSSNGLNNAAVPAFAAVYVGTAAGTTYLYPASADGLAGGLTRAHLEIGTNDMNAATPTQPVDFGRYVASGVAYLLAQGFAAVYLSAPPLCRTSTMTPAQIQAGNGYAAQMAALHNGTTTFYLPPRLQNYAADNPLGTIDGLHGLGPEAQAEGRMWGQGILDALNPAPVSAARAVVIGG